ncbi:MAG: DJ-1/PfpI family protein [Prevotellaceae bacterium]|jgi:4-methyl-5(b-hydroxyethyl)-thiazole monophosphate biosynthesis|nr:DJ-1/PfpI family protein [Prevotellaceae bacterium]
MKKAFLFLAEGFEEIEAIATIDILRRADIALTTVSIHAHKNVIGAHNITIEADSIFTETDFSGGDMLILPGGSIKLFEFSPLHEPVLQYSEQEKYLAAICAAPAILGSLGLLQGKEAVCYPGYENYLQGATIVDKPVVVAGNIITAKAAGCTIEFALTLIELLENKKLADKIAGQIFFQ